MNSLDGESILFLAPTALEGPVEVIIADARIIIYFVMRVVRFVASIMEKWKHFILITTRHTV